VIKTYNELEQKFKKVAPDVDTGFIKKAYEYANLAHDTQKRASGDPYIVHPLNVASILIDFNMYDTAAIAAALLHDTLEDTAVTSKDLEKEFGRDNTSEPDLEPQDEKDLSEYYLKNENSDFVFVTHFPTSKRPFYAYPTKADPTVTDSFDLIYRGIEVTTGGQRIHDYNQLIEKIKERKLDPKNFESYLEAFKFGMPPHGGLAIGLERLTAKFLNLDNVKKATLFPRDLKRLTP